MLLQTSLSREHLLSERESGHTSGGLEKGYGTIADTLHGDSEKACGNVDPTNSRPLGEDWMSHIDEETLLSALTIPGTHDSAAFTYSWPFVQTQRMGILQQLNAGIRYFDLRCGVRDDIVEMVHGPTFLSITLRTVLDTMYIWLKAHSTEALIVQIKQDRKSMRSTVNFAHAIWKCMAEKPEHWRTANTTPKLGELRGKIQLLRRFAGPSLHAYGIDVTQWHDNPSKPFTINTWHGVRLTIQDHYSFPDPESLPSLITKKGGDVSELLARAANDPDAGHWYINFTSAFEFNFYYQVPPREVAVGGWWAFRWEEGMNPRLRNYLRDHQGKQRFGIVAMDFPEGGTDDLIAALLRSNLENRTEKRFWWILLVKVLVFLFLTSLIIIGLYIRLFLRSAW